jgi:hypothetical protein
VARCSIKMLYEAYSDWYIGYYTLMKQRSRTHAPLWPDVQSRCCMRHIAIDFYAHFKNMDLMNLFKGLCS